MLLTTLLALPTALALDVNDEGGLLVLYDETGTREVNEVTPDGTWRALTDLGETCRNARFVPGSRQVVVQHDTGGDERGQLSLVDLDDRTLTPLVHDPAFKHNLVQATGGRVLFTTNRRNGVDFDLVSHDLATGAESVLYDGGGWAMAVDASPDGKWVVLSLASAPANSVQLLLVDTTTRAVSELTAPDSARGRPPVRWTRSERPAS